jgi:hypothetical protein
MILSFHLQHHLKITTFNDQSFQHTTVNNASRWYGEQIKTTTFSCKIENPALTAKPHPTAHNSFTIL